jgi:hypothetical protein
MRPTLVISDLHAPHTHKDALAFLCAVRDKYKTKQTICIGDEADGHAISFHTPNPDLRSPGDELTAARNYLSTLRSEFPAIRFCESNHGSLYYRRAIEHGLPRAVLKSYQEIYDSPHWTWHDEIVEYVGDKIPVLFRHQFGKNVRSALARVGGACIVQGHYHSEADTVWLNSPRGRLFGLTVGCLIDSDSLAFAYNHLDLARPVLGCGAIIDGLAIHIPMWTNRRGRWTGKVS